MYFTVEKKLEKGAAIVYDLLCGKITDFKEYVESTTKPYQSMLTRAKSIGKCVSEYIFVLDDDSKTKVVDMIFATPYFEFIEIFRIAKDLATKFDKYEENTIRRKSYLLQHSGVTQAVFDSAYGMAKYSTIAKKTKLSDKGINYGDIQQDFITA